MASPKNQLIFNPLPPCHSLSLIVFQLPLTLSPTNSEKVFPDKPSTNVYSYFNIMYVYYTKPQYQTSTSEQLSEKAKMICTSWHQLDVVM